MAEKEEILKKVRAAFEFEPRINLHHYPVQMDFNDGTLTLEGMMENVAAKKLALELAIAAPGVTGILDRLKVTPSAPMTDAEIRDHVRDGLLEEPAFRDCAIRVQVKGMIETVREPPLEKVGDIEIIVEDGAVLLEGRVPSLSHKRMAGVIGWWVPGSTNVLNCLEVMPPEEDNDDEVTDAVRLVLEKDPFINADQIRISSRNCVVTLEGLVPNEKEKQMAEFDAWSLFGVDKVINQIEVQE
jgi:osmotically-inducible protein OsmY